MNYETKELKTDRLIIKRGLEEDYLKVYEYDFSKLKDIDGVFKLEKQDLSKVKEWFKGGIKSYYNKLKKAHMFDWIIYVENVPVGNILTTEENMDKKEIEISYNLHPSFWGNGYIREAITSVMEYLFSIGYDNIVCGFLDGDLKAKKTLNMLGFKPYEIIEDEYKSESGNLIDKYKTIMTKDEWFSKTGRIKL